MTECGRYGIVANASGLVTHNRVSQTGEYGIWMIGSPPSSYGHNTISFASLAGGGFYAVGGGRASAGNSCDDGSCSPDGKRRAYVTSQAAPGGTAAALCATGFRVARLDEIWDPSAVYWEPNLGEAGMPAGYHWVNWFVHCSEYTSFSGNGVRVAFEGPNPISGEFRPWVFNITPCTDSAPAWCIEE